MQVRHTTATLCVLLLLDSDPVTSAAVGRRRRSDDTQPLQAVVDHLAQQVALQSAQIAALQTKTDVLGKAVAFHAWHNTNPIRAGPSSIIVFDHVATNVGNAYSALTGTFVAPVSGLYDFQVTFMTYVSGQKVYMSMYVDGALVAIGLADSLHSRYDQSTIRAVVHVTSGQTVFVRNSENQPAEYYSDNSGGCYSTFSGFLIKAD